ncbi:MAG TPA: hypothetical protein VFG20_04010 [Planctomycetaceae bacterium]|nr:hypothetical protein [Planctomycetaceae bacterium]
MSLARIVLVWCLCSTATSVAIGQELRVFTRTVDLSGLSPDQYAKAPIIARSITLFHAGKVYDYIDSAREVTIFEPVHRRFTILHEASGAVTSVSQDEVRRFLEMAEDEGLQRIASGTRNGAGSKLDFLRFQLRPEFKIHVDEPASRVRMEHTLMQYEAECAAPPPGMMAKAYFDYADAIVQLNAVLHPQSIWPAPRLQLNDELRQREWLPRSVRRQINGPAPSDLRAEHEWEWKLNDHSRQMLAKWDRELREGSVRKLEFRQFQQEILTGKLTSTR